MIRSIVVLGALLAVASPLAAQGAHAQARQGFGISFGLGFGSAGLSCDGCSSERETALSGYLRIGGHPRPDLFVGGESNGWTNSEDGIDEQVGFLAAVVQWYPEATAGFHLKAGLGLAKATATDGFDEISTEGLGLNLGLGYDWRLARNFSLTPYVNYLRSVGAELKVNGSGTDFTANTSVLQFGLGFTWH
jgi:hypothetical protein